MSHENNRLAPNAREMRLPLWLAIKTTLAGDLVDINLDDLPELLDDDDSTDVYIPESSVLGIYFIMTGVPGINDLVIDVLSVRNVRVH